MDLDLLAEILLFDFEKRFGVPCCDPLWHGASKVAAAIIDRFVAPP